MEPKVRRQVLQMLHSGMYVMVAGRGEHACAATITWVSQASFRPPLIMAAVRKRSRLFEHICRSRVASLNILACSQLDLARKFFTNASALNGAFAGERFSTGATEAPVLQDTPAYIECEVRRIVDDVGDHAIVIMEVVDAQRRRPARTLSVAESPWRYGG